MNPFRNWLAGTRISRRAGRAGSSVRVGLEALEARLVPAGNLRVIEAEPNDTINTAQVLPVQDARLYDTPKDSWVVVLGQVSRNPFDAGGVDDDFYKITLDRPAALALDLDHKVLPNISPFYRLQLDLLDANGATIRTTLDGTDYFTGAADGDASMYQDLPAGTYYVGVKATLDGNALQAAGFPDPALVKAQIPGNYQLRVLTDSGYSTTVPIFESNPASPVKLYLDMDGYTGVGDQWARETNRPSYTVGAINLTGEGHEGNANRFSPAELLLFKNIWKVVAEDYSPFNVDITTREPANFANFVATRNVVTDKAYFFFPQQFAGIAPGTGSFAYNAATPTLSFLGAGIAQVQPGGNTSILAAAAITVGDTVAHEIGHTLGVQHSGAGGPGPEFISPIVPDNKQPFPKPYPQGSRLWSNGVNETGGFQSDMLVIAGPGNQNRLTFRPDEDATGPIRLTAAAGVYTANGVISTSNDVDTYEFRGSGQTTIVVLAAQGTGVADLDTVLDVRGPGVPLRTANPPGTPNAAISLVLPQDGIYAVSVRGTGRKIAVDPNQSFDVTGQYFLYIATVLPAVNQPPAVTLPGAPVTINQNGGAVLLDPQATVTDADSPNFNGGRLTVTIRTNGTADDRLALATDNNVTVAANGTVRVGGVHVGTVSGGNGAADPLVITFTTANATPQIVQELLRRITISNVTIAPQTAARTVAVVVTDPANAANAAATKVVTVIAAPQPPQMKVETNTGLTVPRTAPELLTAAALVVSSPNGGVVGPPTITYTVTRVPQHGQLLIARASDVPGQPNFLPVALRVGETFTQDDLANNRVAYRLTPGSTADHDAFFFTAADGLGGAVADTRFVFRVTQGAVPVQAPRPQHAQAVGPFAFAGPSPDARLDLGANPATLLLTPSLLNYTGATDHRSLEYEIVSGPQYGTLSFPTGFTQRDVDGNMVIYRAPALKDLPAGVMGDSFSYVVTNTETGGITDAITFFIAFDNPNSAPQFQGQSDGIVLPAVFDEATGAAVTHVRDLARGVTNDPDSLEGTAVHYGIAVVGVDTANGRWEFSTDGGENWQPLENVSPDNALLLEGDDSETAFRFLPNPGFAGQANFFFRLWDQTEGESGGFVSLNEVEGVSLAGLSAATGRAVQVITRSHDPSFMGGPAVTVSEDAGAVVTPGWASNIQDDGQGDPVTFTFAQPDDTESSDAEGGDELGGSSLEFVETPTIGADGTLRFQTAAGSFGTADFIFYAVSGDRTSAGQLLHLTVNSVNDAPNITLGPDISVGSGADEVRVPHWASGIGQGPSNEGWQGMSATLTSDHPELFAVRPALDLYTGTLTFTPRPGAFGTALVSVQVKDDGGTANGGHDTSIQVFTLIINPSPHDLNMAWVEQVYHDVLRREPDGNLAGWVGMLDAGTSRMDVAAMFTSSQEYKVLVAEDLFVTLLHRDRAMETPQRDTGLIGFVNALLPAGVAGLNGGVGLGYSLEQAEDIIFHSAEYAAVRGGGSDAGFLDALYPDALGRPINADERNAWLNSGQASDHGRVAGLVLGSPEYRMHLTDRDFQAFLHRAASAEEQSAFARLLASGYRAEDVLDLILGSKEYFDRLD